MDSGKTMVLWTAIGLVLTVCQPVEATEKYAAQTGRPCAQCHVYPTGDARLTPYGQAFVANGFRVPVNVPPPPAPPPKIPSSEPKPPN
jgi:hypothetical protein